MINLVVFHTRYLLKKKKKNEDEKSTGNSRNINGIGNRTYIKFSHIKSHARNTCSLTFESRAAANDSVTNKYLKELKFTTFIPRYLRVKRRVV